MQQRLFVYQRSKNAKPLVPMMELIRDVVV